MPIAVAVAIWLPAVALARPLAALHVDVQDDQLTVRAHEAPLGDVLAAIASRLGAEVHGRLDTSRIVDVQFANVALPDGLARLLGRESFALVYGKDGTARSIHVLSGAQDGAGADAATASAGAPPTPQVPVPQPPARRLGRPRPLQQAPTPAQATLGAVTANHPFITHLREATGESPAAFLARLASTGTSDAIPANAAAAFEEFRRARAARAVSAQPFARDAAAP